MFVDLIGFIGMGLILFAFSMDQFKKWKSTDLKFDVVNGIGAGLLVVYAWMIQSYPFLILNLVWLIVSVKAFILDKKKK